MVAGILVHCVAGTVPWLASDLRLWQGAPTQEYWESFEEAQRRQGRRGPGCARDRPSAIQLT